MSERPTESLLAEGLYAVVTPKWVAGFVVEGGEVTMCAPVLLRRLAWWTTRARYVGRGPSRRARLARVPAGAGDTRPMRSLGHDDPRVLGHGPLRLRLGRARPLPHMRSHGVAGHPAPCPGPQPTTARQTRCGRRRTR